MSFICKASLATTSNVTKTDLDLTVNIVKISKIQTPIIFKTDLESIGNN